MESDREDRIRRRAYEIWQRDGGGHGQDADHWRAAEEELRQEEQSGQQAASEPTGGAADALARHTKDTGRRKRPGSRSGEASSPDKPQPG